MDELMQASTAIQAHGGGAMKTYEIGDGPYRVSYARGADGALLWVEIVSGDQALFRADKHPGEDQLWIARDMVQAHNARLGREVAA